MDISKIKVSGTLYDIKDASARSSIDNIVLNLASVATSGSYNDLADKPTIGSGVLTILKNGTAIDTFGANATGDKTINVIVPTKVSDLTNDSGFITNQSLITVMDYKGTKATVSALPSSGNKNGDVWHVTENDAEYAWNGSTWEELGTPIDLSGYATTESLATVATSGSYDDLTNKPAVVFNRAGSSSTYSALITGGDQSDSTSPTYAKVLSGNGANVTLNSTGGNIVVSGSGVSITAGGSGAPNAKLTYNNNEVATVNQIPTVNNAALTIQKNSTTVKTFTANASSAVNVDITMQYGGTTGDNAETLILNVA